MRGRLPLPPFPGQTAGGGVPAAPRRLAPTSFPGLPPAETPAAAHSRANRRGRRPRHPAKACAVANNNPCLPPWGKVAPQGRMRGGLPLPLIPGQTVGAASPTPRGGLRRRPSPGYHPRRLPLPPTPAEGSRPLPTDRTIDGCSRHPPGRACPAPTVRRPGNGCPRKPRGRFHIPIRRAGCPHPAATSRCRQQQPLPSPLGEGGPAGPDEGQAPPAALPRANRRGRRPRRPAKPCANTHPPDSHPRRGQDPSLRTEPLTGACVTPPGRACPAPTVRRSGNGCPRKSRGRFHIPIRRAGCPHPAATSRCRQQQPLPSPLGEGGPAGPDEGQAPAAARSQASRRGRRPRRPAKPCANGHPPGNHPQTSAHANLRAGHARPLPGDNPAHLYTTQKGGSHT